MESYNLKKETCISPSQFETQKGQNSFKKKNYNELTKNGTAHLFSQKKSQKQFGVIIA